MTTVLITVACCYAIYGLALVTFFCVEDRPVHNRDWGALWRYPLGWLCWPYVLFHVLEDSK